VHPCKAALAILAALAVAGCASTPELRPAHGVLPGGGESAWDRAREVLRERGDEVALADPTRGILVTREREREVPCAAASCRAREVLHLRLDDGRAAAKLELEVWDAPAAAWRPPSDPATVAAVVAEERSLLERLRATRIEVRLGRAGEGCSAAADCDSELTCVARRCVKVRAGR
jgi:hypothetical protein